MRRLNLNSYIKVKLTDYGKNIYYHRYDILNRHMSMSNAKLIEPHYPDVDKDGFSKFQLWDFMKLYGQYMIMGSSYMIIEPLDIFIDEENLEETNV